MLDHLIGNAPRFMRQFVEPIMSVLVPKLRDQDPNPAVTVCILTAIGDLAQVLLVLVLLVLVLSMPSTLSL